MRKAFSNAVPVQGAINVGDRFPSTMFSISITGDVSQLGGHTLYLIIEVPPGIYEGDPTITIAGQTAYIALSGAPQGEVGTRSGGVVFHVCLDPTCSTELAGSPTSASYQVAVGPGLVVEAPDLFEVNAVFGTNPAPVEFPVTLPVGSLGLEVSVACRSDYADPAYTDDYTCCPLVHETVTGTVR